MERASRKIHIGDHGLAPLLTTMESLIQLITSGLLFLFGDGGFKMREPHIYPLFLRVHTSKCIWSDPYG